MTVSNQPSGKKLLIRAGVTLLICILAGIGLGYLFIEMPHNIPAEEAGYLKLGLGFAYGLVVGFGCDLLLVALFFFNKVRSR
ncbi:MAG: hypothetical protein V7731_22230 [Amphritea sp.]